MKANLFLGRRRGAAADRLRALRALRRHLAAAAVVLAALPDPGAVARRRAAVLRASGPSSCSPRRRSTPGATGSPSRCWRSGCSRSSPWRGSGRRCSGRRIPTATTPSPGALPAAMLAPLVALSALVVWVGVERRAVHRRGDGGRRRDRRPGRLRRGGAGRSAMSPAPALVRAAASPPRFLRDLVDLERRRWRGRCCRRATRPARAS